MILTSAISLLLSLPLSGISLMEGSISTIEVFYKEMPPSIETLERVDQVLSLFMYDFDITYHVITDSSSFDLIEQYGLPETHFPFAVVINRRFSASVEGDRVDFVHFPLFMHGIGRHEGNWSLEALEMVLSDTSLLLEESVLPELDESTWTACPEDSTDTLVDSILADAISYLGTPYVYGGTDENGFDCSGLAWRVFNDNGVPLPRTVGAIEDFGIPVSRDELQPGDLLIFGNPRHTGIYLGDGQFIHCSSWQDRGVVITPLSHSNYDRRYESAVRVLGTGPDY